MSGNDGPSVGRAIESARGRLKIPVRILLSPWEAEKRFASIS